ncbi:hypothetical protein N9M90_02630 [Alphaproteobacteria bacterium]|nr:hypothetical protein [Alphaproteobacteria bacterium]
MNNDVAEQFQLLNKHIAAAISAKDYARATALDRARQEILRDICLMDMTKISPDFFNIVEECARDNASLIQAVRQDMNHISWQTSRSLKAQRAYRSEI